MASSSGTSVRGTQLLLTNLPKTDTYAYLTTAGSEDDPPSRVGFLYVVLYEGGAADQGTVIDTRVVYRPGTYFRWPIVNSDATDRWKIWMDWNVSGLTWNLSTF